MVRSLLEVNVEIWNGRLTAKNVLDLEKYRYVALNLSWKTNTAHTMKPWHFLNLRDWVHDAILYVYHLSEKQWNITLTYISYKSHIQLDFG